MDTIDYLFDGQFPKPSNPTMDNEDIVVSSYKSPKFSDEENELHNVMDAIVYNFLCKNKTMAVCGAAGTGKTTIIKNIIETHFTKKIFLCAPTHKAVSQFPRIEQVLKPHQIPLCNIHIGTLQSGLGIQTEIDDEGEEVYSITGTGKLYKIDFDYIIVDEASMVSYDYYYKLMELNKPVLFIGDKNQLPPVTNKYEEFSVFNIIPENKKVYMRYKKRYNNDKLRELTNEIENAIETNRDYNNLLLDILIRYNDVFKGTKDLSKEELHQLHYIDYTNTGGVYHHLGKKGHYYLEGKEYYLKGRQNKEGLNKIDTYTILSLEEHFIEWGTDKKLKYKIAKIKGKINPIEQTVILYNPMDEDMYKELKREIRKYRKKMKQVEKSLFEDEYSDFTEEDEKNLNLSKEQIAIIMKAMVMYPVDIFTVHAAQGATMDKVLVNLGSFKFIKTKTKEQENKMKLKLLYVAVSRARDMVYFKY